LGDPEGGKRKMVSQIFWDRMKENWILVAYNEKGNLIYIQEYGKA